MKMVFSGMFLFLHGTLSAMDLGAYQVILDKQLLGRKAPEPPPVVQPPPQALPAPSWARQYRMTMMTMDQPDGTVRVGLQNLQDQSAILLIQGKNRHPDFTLISASYKEGTAQIAYMGSTHLFDLETVSTPTASAPPSTLPRATRPSPRTSSSSSSRRLSRTTPRAQVNGQDGSPSLQIRRFASQEELQAHLMEQQMDAIRTGKPPLPIPLTPDMDAQLVREGVLPPVEQK